MKALSPTRRDFLLQASVAAVATPLLIGCRGSILAQPTNDVLVAIRRNAVTDPSSNWTGAKDVPDNVGWKTSLAAASDPGERLLISGTVYGPDGRSPAPNTLIYLYHTDVHGKYGTAGEHRHGRYRGWVLTDARGIYEFSSIRPASYPASTIAAHIHMTVTGTERREDWIDSILFEGDRFITPRERVPARGGFNPVLKLTRGADGVHRGVRDIRLG